MIKRNFSGLGQVFGLLGCIFFFAVSFVWLFSKDENLAWEMRLVLVFLCLFLDALALRSLFEGDDSPMGKFFFRIGDFAMGLVKSVLDPLVIGLFGGKFKDLPKDADNGEGQQSRNRDSNKD